MDKKTYEKGLEILELYRLQNYTECQKKCKKVITMEPNSELSDLAQLTWKKIKFERYDDYQELIRGWKNPAESIAMEQNCNGDSSEAINKLNKLIGLNNVKEEIIKIQKRLELEKYRKKEKVFIKYGELGKIVVDRNYELIDGYCSYLICKKYGMGKVPVWCE